MPYNREQWRQVQQQARVKLPTPAQLQARCQRIAGRGLEAAGREFANMVREALSIPAPRVLFRAKDGSSYYRAGWMSYGGTKEDKTHVTHKSGSGKGSFIPSPADAQAIPRKLSGTLRRNVDMDYDSTANVTHVGILKTADTGESLEYARRLELDPQHPHKFLKPTLEANLHNLAAIIGQQFSASAPEHREAAGV